MPLFRNSTSAHVSKWASERLSRPSRRTESRARSTLPRQEALSADSCFLPSPRGRLCWRWP